jgi:chromosomal replication initiator protein
VSEQEFVMWFQQIEYARSEEQTITVAVPSSFYRDQVKQRYLDLIEEKLSRALRPETFNLDFEIRSAEMVRFPSRRESSPGTVGPWCGATANRRRSSQPDRL